MADKVFWTDEDFELVAKTAAKIYLEGGITKLDSVSKAQKEVPVVSRSIRSSMTGPSNKFGRIMDKWIAIHSGNLQVLNKEPVDSVVKKPVLEKILPESVDYVEGSVTISTDEVIEYSPYDAFIDAASTLMEDLIGKVVERCIIKMHVAVSNKISPQETMFEKVMKHRPEMPDIPKDRLPTAFIVGIKNGNQAEIQRRFTNRVNLKFWFDNNLKTLSEKAKNADYVLASMASCSHQAFYHLNAVRKDAIRITGGNSNVIQCLEQLLMQARNNQICENIS